MGYFIFAKKSMHSFHKLILVLGIVTTIVCSSVDCYSRDFIAYISSFCLKNYENQENNYIYRKFCYDTPQILCMLLACFPAL